MTRSTQAESLGAVLGPMLAERGFSRADRLCYTRKERDGVGILAFAARVDRNGTLRFTFGVGVRFPAVEALLHPAESDPFRFTVGSPIHLLRTPRTYSEWQFRAGAEDATTVQDVASIVDSIAVPYLERIGDLAAVQADLESADPRHWYTLTPGERATTLLCIRVCLQGKDGAVRGLADIVGELSAKDRRLFTEVLQRVTPTSAGG